MRSVLDLIKQEHFAIRSKDPKNVTTLSKVCARLSQCRFASDTIRVSKLTLPSLVEVDNCPVPHHFRPRTSTSILAQRRSTHLPPRRSLTDFCGRLDTRTCADAFSARSTNLFECKPLIVIRSYLVATFPVIVEPAQIHAELSRLSRNIRAQVPGIGFWIERSLRHIGGV